jgi:hypothetical protein
MGSAEIGGPSALDSGETFRRDQREQHAPSRLRLGDIVVNEAVERSTLVDDNGTDFELPIADAQTGNRRTGTGKGGTLTRNGRILFSLGNWIAVFADRSRRQGIRCRMPDFHPQLASLQPLNLRSRKWHFFALPGRAGQQWPRAQNRWSEETIFGRTTTQDCHWALLRPADLHRCTDARKNTRITAIYCHNLLCFFVH